MFWVKYDNVIFFVFYSKKNNGGVRSDQLQVNLNALNLMENDHSLNKNTRHVGRVLDEDVIEIFI